LTNRHTATPLIYHPLRVSRVVSRSIYIAYDVQCLLGGDHKYAVSPDEYVMGAIAIYLDIINLFMHILRLLSSSDRN
jgi:FtsH-binding integral membrane protein